MTARIRRTCGLIGGTLILCLAAGWAEDLQVGPARRTTAGKEQAKNAEATGEPAGRGLSAPPAAVNLGPLAPGDLSVKVTPHGNRVLGLTRKLTQEQIAAGVWEYLPDSRRVWRFSLQSPGALGLRVHFAGFEVGGGKVWVYAMDRERNPQAIGPYTGKGPTGTGDFWSGLVAQDSAVIEYQPAPGDQRTDLPFRVAAVSHLSSSPIARGRPGLRPIVRRQSGEGFRPAAQTKDGSFGQALGCELDVNCALKDWQYASLSVGLFLTFEDDYVIACSGTLLNNMQKSFRPYFLTANHCVSTGTAAVNSLVLWNLQTNFCNGDVPDLTSLPQQAVARLLVTRPIDQGDYTLLLLSGSAPQNAVYSGWRTQEPGMGAFVVSIHHPEATWKRLSAGNRVLDQDVQVVDDQGNVMAVAPANRYYEISWSVGVTEPGSSGAPLFDADSYLVGVLSHGNVDCSGQGFDGYGRFSGMITDLRQYLVDDSL